MSCIAIFNYMIFLFHTYCLSIVEGSLRTKNFIANDCFTVIVVHMTIKKLLDSTNQN